MLKPLASSNQGIVDVKTTNFIKVRGYLMLKSLTSSKSGDS
ncbi:hypothetical protein [Desemzia sp. FAM 24101]